MTLNLGIKLHCHWYVTTRCNSRCKTCSIWQDPKYKSPETSLNSRIKLLREIKQLGFLSIDFTGGEPLLYKDLPALIKEARRMGFFTWLTTNGVLYPKYARALKGNLTQLCFSLDSHDKEIHDQIRGVKCFDKVIQSIKIARNLGETPMIKTTICEENVDGLPEIIKLAQDLGVLIELNAEFSYFGNRPLSKKNIRKMLKFKSHPNVIVSIPQLKFILDGGNNPIRPKCPIGKNLIVLTPNNELYFPCMHLVKKTIPLIDGSLLKTMNDEHVKEEFKKVGTFPFCNGCTIPCYMEAAYYTQIDKYFFPCYFGRIDYLKKRLYLSIRNRI
ncbi:MAG: radical SAM protein [Candidatus Helarchaeales archaeon]